MAEGVTMTNTADPPKPEENNVVADLKEIKRRVGQIAHHAANPSRHRREIQQLDAEIDRMIARYSRK
jgi:hypothetical protein